MTILNNRPKLLVIHGAHPALCGLDAGTEPGIVVLVLREG